MESRLIWRKTCQGWERYEFVENGLVLPTEPHLPKREDWMMNPILNRIIRIADKGIVRMGCERDGDAVCVEGLFD